jgi:hypothetical protein
MITFAIASVYERGRSGCKSHLYGRLNNTRMRRKKTRALVSHKEVFTIFPGQIIVLLVITSLTGIHGRYLEFRSGVCEGFRMPLLP